MMRFSAFVGVVALSLSLGCGAPKVDTSTSVPPPSSEDVTQDIEKAMESGAIDPETYGQ